jgi:hypothetical protein
MNGLIASLWRDFIAINRGVQRLDYAGKRKIHDLAFKGGPKSNLCVVCLRATVLGMREEQVTNRQL